MSQSYKRVADDQHVLKTEDALRHWDSRRAGDQQWITHPPQNIGQVVYRHDGFLRALFELERRGLDITKANVLDVGAANGYGLRYFLVNGFRVDQLHGVDLFADRVEMGHQITPGIDLRHGDGAALPYPDASFDIVCEQFCFCHIPDQAGIKEKISAEMLRVTKPGGYILVNDWRMGSESKKLYGMSVSRIKAFFPGLPIVARYRSQLFPPIGRPVSKYFPALYGLFRLVPFLTGSWLTVLQKPAAAAPSAGRTAG